jgi:opacity protein-like surface antigen
MRWTTILAAALSLTLGQTAAAQSREGSWETRLAITFQNSSDADFNGGTKAKFDSDSGFKAGLSYHLTDNIEFGGSLGLGQRDYDADIATDIDGDGDRDGFTRVRGDLDYTTIKADATWNVLPGPLTPFVTGSIGWAWVDTNIATEPPEIGCWWDPWWGYVCTSFQDTRDIDGFSYGIGVGARYDFSDTFAVQGSYRIDWIDFENTKGTPDYDGFELSIGWKF